MINTLTSLRILFALMVFGAHCYVLDPSFATHFFKEGFVGVSFFFILSGFIIAYNYEEKLLEKITTKRTFWVARIARRMYRRVCSIQRYDRLDKTLRRFHFFIATVLPFCRLFFLIQ